MMCVSTQKTVFSASLAELQCAMNNMFVTCDMCLQDEGNNFQDLLYISNEKPSINYSMLI